jgi:hypothetical protein
MVTLSFLKSNGVRAIIRSQLEFSMLRHNYIFVNLKTVLYQIVKYARNGIDQHSQMDIH